MGEFSIDDNGKRENLNKFKHGVRKEQVDKKFHNLFDAYDANRDGTLESEELGGIFKQFKLFAGEDGNLSNEEARTLLDAMGLKNIDTSKFFEFIQSMYTDDNSSEVVSKTVEQLEEIETEDEEVIVTYPKEGESFAQTAKRLGFEKDTPEYVEFLQANEQAGERNWFKVGEQVKIPKSLYEKVNQDELLDEVQGKAEVKKYSQAVSARSKEETKNEALYKQYGLINHKGQGKKYKISGKLYTVVGQCEYSRQLLEDVDGQIVVISHDGMILNSEYTSDDTILKYNQKVKDRKEAEKLAQEFYQIADENHGQTSMQKMQKLLNTKIHSGNIVDFLDAYDREKTKNGDSSIIDTITSEIGAGGTEEQQQVLMSIMNKLCDAAKKAGVPQGDIKKAKKDFEESLIKEFSASFRRTNPKDMEKAVDFLRGAIAAKANKGGAVSEQAAILDVQATFAQESQTAQTDYKNARDAEGWAAKVGDTVCGWFGGNTIADMDAKLGENAAAVKRLASAKTEVEFKKIYKEIFGIEFDSNKIAARQTAIDKYNLASNCASTVKIADKLIKKYENNTKDTVMASYSMIRSGIREGFNYKNADIDNIINAYAIEAGISNPTVEQKKELLLQFLKDTKNNAQQNFVHMSDGKTLEQMGKDVDLITRSTFGTNDIVKDVIQFNQNQQTVEMVTEAAAEIAGTIALQFVPGLGQMAAAKLAASAAKWGTKAVRVANYATKAEKAFSAVNKFQKGEAIANATTKGAKAVNKGVQVASQVVNAGVATAGVDLSDGKSVKETTKKALMNMSFAGVGASSSILAPKLMQVFGIADKALATEIAEEIINAAGSYGVTKLEGGEYGKTDAFIDFASGLIMSRISHVKVRKPHAGLQTVKNEAEEIIKAKVNSIDTKLKKCKNRKEIIEEFEKGNVYRSLIIHNGKIDCFIGDFYYEIMFDKTGQILCYSKLGLLDTKSERFLYNSKGKPENVTKEKYELVEELYGLESTQIDIETLIKNNGTDILRFNSLTVNELNSLVRNADDSRILNALLIDKNFKMPIDSQLNISSVREYTYNCDDIINILKSDKAKAFILNKINSGTSFSKSDLKKLDKDLFFDPSSYKLETKRDLSHTIEDLQLTDNNGNPIEDWTLNYLFEINPTFRQRIPAGEVANINGHMYVNDGGHLTKLELSKETFEALFPIEKRHKINQGVLGDCWLVTSMGALMDSPKGRASIYKMFSQDGNDILVKFPDADESIRFKNGELNNLAPVSIWFDRYKPHIGFGYSHVYASKGIRMIEQAYSIHRNDGYGKANIKDKDIQDIFFMNKQMKRLTGGFSEDAIINIVGKDHVQIRRGFDERTFKKAVNQCIDDPNNILTFGTKHKVGTNTKYDLVSGHAYHIVAFDREKGILSISNPWHNNEIKQIPFRDWLNYVGSLEVIEII